MGQLDAVVHAFRLFTNHVLCHFVSPQSEKDRLTRLVVVRPLRELDLSDQHRLDPVASFHDCRGDALTPPALSFLWQVSKGASLACELLHAGVEARQRFFGEASADSAGKKQSIRTLVADDKEPKYLRLPSGSV